MSSKRRANVTTVYVDESSSEEDFDCGVSSSGRSAPGRHEDGSVASNGSSETRRRGRGVSKRPCLNRNAQMARENRQRKKEYLETVESKLAFYQRENKNLSTRIQRQGIDLKRLNAEVSYLKNVLHNSSSITTLLKSMNDTLSGKNIIKSRHTGETQRQQRNSESSNCSDDKDKKSNWNATWRLGGKYVDCDVATTNQCYNGGNLKDRSIGDSDHTYTTSRDGSEDGNNKQNYYPEIDAVSDNDDGCNGLRKMATDRFINNLSTSSLAIGIPEDELPEFDANIFESISNEPESVEYFRNDCLNDGNLFENLENSGICLHVNSGKISLEFCSICHLNSINSNE